MTSKTTDYQDYDRIIEGLVDFWLCSRPLPKLEFSVFCDLLEQHLSHAMDEYQEWVEIDM
jgi:hypothetical protein